MDKVKELFAVTAPPSQVFLLIGTGFLIPVILIYTGFAQLTFRGKVKQGERYH